MHALLPHMCKNGVQPHNNSRGWMIYFFNHMINPPTPTPKMPPTGIMYRTCRRESYLYGGVIFIHKVVLDELDGECTLAHASSSYHHQLILRHLCRCCSPHTHTHHCWREDRGQRKVQVSSLMRNIHTTRFEQTYTEL